MEESMTEPALESQDSSRHEVREQTAQFDQQQHLPPALLIDPIMSAGDSGLPVSPLSSTAPSPMVKTPRRPSQPASSPNHLAGSPNHDQLRRASSAMSMTGARSAAASPRLSKKGSRTSLNGQTDSSDRRPTPKRSISNLIAGLREAQATMGTIEEPTPLTAAQIATQHFRRELAAHGQGDAGQSDADAATVVILHDACYGHRWSRLRTTKTTLSIIVERPERIRASVLGTSLAYVRLGGHHAGAVNAPHPHIDTSSPPPFNIRRSSRSVPITDSCVTNVHGKSWMTELHEMCDLAAGRLAAGVPELTRSQSTSGAEDKPMLHEGDLYLAPESRSAFEGALGGVADAIDAVFAPHSRTRRAFVAVRPPGHHCSSNLPSGFCWLNNVHVGIEYAAQHYGLTHAAILDFDLHHGDGSQSITWERNSKNNVKRLNAKANSKLKLNPDIGYYSLHDINSYPCESGDDDKVQAASLCVDNAHGQSIWNVHLQPWKTEEEFWQLYESQYTVLLDKARGFLRRHASRIRAEHKTASKAAVFISAGFDASEWEGVGMQRHKVNVPTSFYARFTSDVVRIAQEDGTDCNGRVISVLEGGYSDRALCSGVLSHLSGLCKTSVDEVTDKHTPSLDTMMRGLQLDRSATEANIKYEHDWWSAANLSALENQVNPPPPAAVKKMRNGNQPTYATPTESFAYKVIDPNKFARSISGTMRDNKPTRPPTPPPPEVDWIVATQELSNLLIPEDRTTTSCSAEELAAPRVKKEKPEPIDASVSDAPGVGKGRQLRDRGKVKPPSQYAESSKSDELESVRSVSRSSNRRQTVHDLPLASNDANETRNPRPRRESRRLSAMSAASTTNDNFENSSPPVPVIPAAFNDGQMRPPPARASSSLQIKKVRPPIDSVRLSEPTSVSAPVSPAKASGRTVSAGHSHAQGSGDVDALTSGLKRITLKVGTREEHDRKQKEREAAERRARAMKGAETRRMNAAAKKAANNPGPGVTKPTAPSRPQTAQTQPSSEPLPSVPHGDKRSVSNAKPVNAAQSDVSNKTNGATASRGQPVVDPFATAATVQTASQPVTELHQDTISVLPSHPNEQEIAMHSHMQPPQQQTQQQGPQATSPSPFSHAQPQQSLHLSHQLHQPQQLGAPPTPRGKLPQWSSSSVIPFATQAGPTVAGPNVVTDSDPSIVSSGGPPFTIVVDGQGVQDGSKNNGPAIGGG